MTSCSVSQRPWFNLSHFRSPQATAAHSFCSASPSSTHGYLLCGWKSSSQWTRCDVEAENPAYAPPQKRDRRRLDSKCSKAPGGSLAKPIASQAHRQRFLLISSDDDYPVPNPPLLPSPEISTDEEAIVLPPPAKCQRCCEQEEEVWSLAE